MQRSIRLALRTKDKDGEKGGDDDKTIGTVFVRLSSSQLFPGDSFTTRTVYIPWSRNMQIELSFRVLCADNYYGPSCTLFCQDHNDDNGHYYCDDDGNRVCLDGYQNPSINCVECVPAEACCEY